MEFKTLKLDSSYRPIQVIDSFDAFCMVWMGRANLVEVYSNKYIRSAHQAFPVPCVIALKRYVKISKITLKCNRRNVFWRDRNTCQYLRVDEGTVINFLNIFRLPNQDLVQKAINNCVDNSKKLITRGEFACLAFELNVLGNNLNFYELFEKISLP